ncbi:MAG: class I SAM-dependent methyltransferase [Candidatus Helarchaeota archaeon]
MGEKRIIKLITHYLQPCHAILDVGCAAGNYIKQIAHQAGYCVGIDPLMETSLLNAKDNLASIRNTDVVLSVGETLPFRNESFDVFLCLSTLQHVHDEEVVLQEIRNCSKSNSILVVQVPITRGEQIAKGDARNFTYSSIQETLISHGFQILKLVPFGYTPRPVQKILHGASRISRSFTKFLIRMANLVLKFKPKNAAMVLIVAAF